MWSRVSPSARGCIRRSHDARKEFFTARDIGISNAIDLESIFGGFARTPDPVSFISSYSGPMKFSNDNPAAQASAYGRGHTIFGRNVGDTLPVIVLEKDKTSPRLRPLFGKQWPNLGHD